MKLLLENQETERLKFRRLEQEDFSVWKEIFEDEITSKYLGMDHLKTADERCSYWFELTFNRYEKDLGGQNVLIDKKTGKIIGQAGLLVREIDGDSEIEVAYSILPKFRKFGYAYEAASKCRDFAFEKKLAQQLYSIIHVENQDSQMLAIKIGMKKIKTSLYGTLLADFFNINRNDWKILKIAE